jgi:hypothetical protein
MSQLIPVIGSPFQTTPRPAVSEADLISLYDQAFQNRVALLMLESHKRPDWDPFLQEKYTVLENRRRMTLDVLVRLADRLNHFDSCYSVFKSIKPYPATPNDTDVIYTGSKNGYERVYQYLLDSGYLFHEWAPQQRTLYDPRGIGHIGKGKKGGTYYIDLYEEISTDYFAYLNKHVLTDFIYQKTIQGVTVNLLRPEPECAIILFHSLFPERTFQLEHFYVPLYYFAMPQFDLDVFIDFVRDNRMTQAIVASLEITDFLHRKYFGNTPAPLDRIFSALGRHQTERQKFQQVDKTPYMFSKSTFWTAFLIRNRDPYSFKSLTVQGLKMLNPRFAWDVATSIKNRMSPTGTYHLE